MGGAGKFFRSLIGTFNLKDQAAAISKGQASPVNPSRLSEQDAKDQLAQRRRGNGAVSGALLGSHGGEPPLGNKSRLGG